MTNLTAQEAIQEVLKIELDSVIKSILNRVIYFKSTEYDWHVNGVDNRVIRHVSNVLVGLGYNVRDATYISHDDMYGNYTSNVLNISW